MSKRVKAAILSVSVGVVLFTIAGGLGVRAASNDDVYRQLGVYTEVLSRIRSEYVEDPNIDKVTSGALHGLLESLDANSSYLTPAEYQKYKSNQHQGRAGIGATISKRFGYGAVISVIPGGPADKAGLQNGDIVEAIEGKSSRDMSLAEVQSLIAGESGSVLTVSVVRPRRPEPTKLSITRDVVKVPAVSQRMLEDNIGYIKVDALPKDKSTEIASKIKALQSSGATRLILDLRGSSSGEESEGVSTANLFLDRGTITYLQGQKYARETFNAAPQKAITKLPMVVLVNRGTAGPAEIVAGALKENSRAQVVGEKTFGVGSVQKVIEIPDGSALILSVAKYYSPSGKAIQDEAVTPNVVVAGAGEDFAGDLDEAPQGNAPEQSPSTPQEDEQLRRAIDLLKGGQQPAQAA
ncbi:MAG: S41 family peptidase [Candidatus Korobacteraceae bacterium]